MLVDDLLGSCPLAYGAAAVNVSAEHLESEPSCEDTAAGYDLCYALFEVFLRQEARLRSS